MIMSFILLTVLQFMTSLYLNTILKSIIVIRFD